MSVISWIILGPIAGFIGKNRQQSGQGIDDIVLGIVGAVIGGAINFFGAAGVTGPNIYSLIVSVIGAGSCSSFITQSAAMKRRDKYKRAMIMHWVEPYIAAYGSANRSVYHHLFESFGASGTGEIFAYCCIPAGSARRTVFYRLLFAVFLGAIPGDSIVHLIGHLAGGKFDPLRPLYQADTGAVGYPENCLKNTAALSSLHALLFCAS